MNQFEASVSKIDKWSTTKSRLFLWVEDEDVFENLQNRRDRLVTEYKKLLAPVFQMLGVNKARWSQKAGCSCGCSPGFILDRKVHITDSIFGNDIHVTITCAPKNAGNPRDLKFSV